VNGFKGEVPDKAGREEPYRFDRDLDMSKSTGQDFDFLRKKYVSLKKDVADYMYKASAKYKEDHPNWSKQPMTNGYFDDWLGLKLIEEQMAAAPPTPKLQPVADVPW
jgi:hypothetical protein